MSGKRDNETTSLKTYRAIPGELVMRDYLALDRTKLANERTLLAFFRTAIMFSVSGVTLLKLFPATPFIIITGYSLIIFGIGFAIYGVVRFKRIHSRLNSLCKKHTGACKREETDPGTE